MRIGTLTCDEPRQNRDSRRSGRWSAAVLVSSAMGLLLGTPQALGNGRPGHLPAAVYASSYDGYLYAVNARTGALLWHYRTPPGLVSAPVLHRGLVYFGAVDGQLRALDARTGRLRWRFHMGGSVARPVVDGNTVYVGNDGGRFVAVNAASGARHWSLDLGDPVQVAPAIKAGRVYISVRDGIAAVDAATGGPIWRYQTGLDVDTDPAVAGHLVYAGSQDRHLYALDTATGRRIWSFTARDAFATAIVVG